MGDRHLQIVVGRLALCVLDFDQVSLALLIIVQIKTCFLQFFLDLTLRVFVVEADRQKITLVAKLKGNYRSS